MFNFQEIVSFDSDFVKVNGIIEYIRVWLPCFPIAKNTSNNWNPNKLLLHMPHQVMVHFTHHIQVEQGVRLGFCKENNSTRELTREKKGIMPLITSSA
jgi:hypothetical protein